MKISALFLLAILVIASQAQFAGLFNLLKGEEDKPAHRPGDVEIITSDRAPKPIGSYSAGTKVYYGGFSIIETAGQIGLNPETGELVEDLEGQVDQALRNLAALIEDNGGSLDKVTRTQLFLSDMANFQTVDGIYAKYFTKNFPARAAVAVKDLPKYCYFEIMAEAVVQDDE